MPGFDLVIVGAGGFSAEYCWVIGAINAVSPQWRLAGLVDDNPDLRGARRHGFEVLGSIEDVTVKSNSGALHFIVAVGSNRVRAAMAARALARGWAAATIVHPSAQIAPSARLCDGVYIAPGSVIYPEARVGRHVILNTHAAIGHHTEVGDFAQLCPGARASGGCWIGKFAFLGSNASLGPLTRVGEHATVGANTHAMGTVESGKVFFEAARAVQMVAETGRRDPGERIIALLQLAVAAPVIDPTPELELADIEGWESICLVRFVLALEDEFGLRLTAPEVSNIATFGDVIRLVESRQQAAGHR